MQKEYEYDIAKQDNQASLDMTQLKYEIANGKYDDSEGNSKEDQAFKNRQNYQNAIQDVNSLHAFKNTRMLQDYLWQEFPEYKGKENFEGVKPQHKALAEKWYSGKLNDTKDKANEYSMKVNGYPRFKERLSGKSLIELTSDKGVAESYVKSVAEQNGVDFEKLKTAVGNNPSTPMDELIIKLK